MAVATSRFDEGAVARFDQQPGAPVRHAHLTRRRRNRTAAADGVEQVGLAGPMAIDEPSSTRSQGTGRLGVAGLSAWRSGDAVLRCAARKGFEVVSELIGQRLHRQPARPDDVRRQQEVQQRQQFWRQQPLPSRGAPPSTRQTGTSDPAFAERAHQRRFVDQTAARGVDGSSASASHASGSAISQAFRR